MADGFVERRLLVWTSNFDIRPFFKEPLYVV